MCRPKFCAMPMMIAQMAMTISNTKVVIPV
jgi:hypothetical protein